MKKILILMVITTMIFTGCSTTKEVTKEATKEATKETTTIAENSENTTTETDVSTNQETESGGDTETEVDSEKVEITLPAKYMEGATQEELDQEYSPYATATINADGSVTFVMSKAMHAAFIEIIGIELTNELNALPGTEEFPNVTAVEINDNYTEFTLLTSDTEMSDEKSMSAIYVYLLGKMYHLFNQTETNIVTVNFKNADSGEIIYTNDSAEMDAIIDTIE